jgi:hypothetical protein
VIVEGKGLKVTLRCKKKIPQTAAAATASLQVALGQVDMTMPQFLSSDLLPTVASGTAVADGAATTAGEGAPAAARDGAHYAVSLQGV